MNLKSNKAITLVALIITVIILLILAGVSLSMVLGDNGLINKAQSSVDKYQQSANNEQAMLNSIEDYFKEYMPGEEMPLPDGWDGNIVTAISDGKHNIIPVPKDFYYVGGNLGNGVIISDNPADKYDGIVDKTTWEYTTSLQGNQFVWIPCTEAEYHKTTNWAGTGQPAWGVYDTTEADDTEKAKVLSYGGFYVARYEAGLADTITKCTEDVFYAIGATPSPGYNVLGTPKSKAGQIPWNCIQYANIKANSENWYASSESVESDLITGTQWDVMLNKFVGTTNENGINFTVEDLVSSKRWGNFQGTVIPYVGEMSVLRKDLVNNIRTWSMTKFSDKQTSQTISNEWNLLTTGASKVTEAYHIYDLAGNLGEVTSELGGLEQVESTYHVIRGGACYTYGNPSVCVRDGGDGNIENMSIPFGFRPILYIK